ncbi:MAG TPA: lipase maturation factor family protein, partial [Candidatus Limnocylindrales bacterium]|nr:lipase maturation factor family protein [Candidatus Limnocylindrales bacterium]
PPLAESPAPYLAAVFALTALVIVLSYWPARNLLGRRQLMNFSFNRFHLVNAYGAFGSVTRRRYEVVVEGSDDERPAADSWREYEFIGKPGDPKRRPPQVAPYHLRLDWLMWFLPISSIYGEGWFLRFIEKLLEHDRGVRSLLRRDPFSHAPPVWVRARFYEYRFTTWREHRETGSWWARTLVGDYLPPMRLEPEDEPARSRRRPESTLDRAA